MHLQKPAPLVPRRWSLEVTERLDAEGAVLEPLDVGEVRAAVRLLRAESAEAVVICFLHSYLNPAHERAAAAIVREEFPEAWLSVSSEVCPEFREYLRGSTAAVNAAVMPIVSRYVDALESRLVALGATAPFYVMQSNGGVMTSASAKERPVYMVESGPAAGVIAAGAVAAPYRYANVLSFDMGGTTAKVGLIQDGQLKLSTEMEVGAQAVTPLGEGRGGGYPVRTPVIDLVEVGAGGGSEAWIDAGARFASGRAARGPAGPRLLWPGRRHADHHRREPGPGTPRPAFFLGGEMALDADAARRAIAAAGGGTLHLDPLAAASGIVEIANAHMIAAMRLVSVQRGYDPRDFVLVAFGGAGPSTPTRWRASSAFPPCSCRRARASPRPSACSPPTSAMSSWPRDGCVWTGSRPRALEALFADFVAEGEARLTRDGVPLADRRMQRSADLRYHGQSFELPVTVPPGSLTAARCVAPERAVPRHARAGLRLCRARGHRRAGERPARRGGRDAETPAGAPARRRDLRPRTRRKAGATSGSPRRAAFSQPWSSTAASSCAAIFSRAPPSSRSPTRAPSCTPAGPPPSTSTATSCSARRPLRSDPSRCPRPICLRRPASAQARSRAEGLFARRRIRQGRDRRHQGRARLTTRERCAKVKGRIAVSYIQIADRFFIGARAAAEVARNKIFINHSCAPNLGIRGQITYVALRDIGVGRGADLRLGDGRAWLALARSAGAARAAADARPHGAGLDDSASATPVSWLLLVYLEDKIRHAKR